MRRAVICCNGSWQSRGPTDRMPLWHRLLSSELRAFSPSLRAGIFRVRSLSDRHVGIRCRCRTGAGRNSAYRARTAMFFRPLWPASEPCLRMRIEPKGIAMSSTTTRRFSKGSFSWFIQYLTATPLRFMNVEGFNIRSSQFLTRTTAISPYLFDWKDTPASAARASATMNPALWRVSTYSGPMLPRHAIRKRFISGSLVSSVFPVWKRRFRKFMIINVNPARGRRGVNKKASCPREKA